MQLFKGFLLCLGHPRGALTYPQPLVLPQPQSSPETVLSWAEGPGRPHTCLSSHPNMSSRQTALICPFILPDQRH